jgi:aminoglycoside 6-adenylyltransferase
MAYQLLEDPQIEKFIRWGEARADVRALLLTSTRARPGFEPDRFSDYDLVIVTDQPQLYMQDEAWLGDFGPVLVLWRDPPHLQLGSERFAYITQYENGLKVDATVTPTGFIAAMKTQETLPDEFDVGYAVLLDKDGLTAGLAPPTYRAHISDPPTEMQYLHLVEEFFHEGTYVVKHLWRDDLLPAKYNLDYAMKHHCLRQMLEWLVASEHNWSWKPGAYGKGLKKMLGAGLWAELEGTYVGANLEENRRAFYRTVELFRRVARTVAERLGYSYLQEMDERCMAYYAHVEHQPRITSPEK